jgi:hypothetical protein
VEFSSLPAEYCLDAKVTDCVKKHFYKLQMNYSLWERIQKSIYGELEKGKIKLVYECMISFSEFRWSDKQLFSPMVKFVQRETGEFKILLN